VMTTALTVADAEVIALPAASNAVSVIIVAAEFTSPATRARTHSLPSPSRS
jgi:hypothetical protein